MAGPQPTCNEKVFFVVVYVALLAIRIALELAVFDVTGRSECRVRSRDEEGSAQRRRIDGPPSGVTSRNL